MSEWVHPIHCLVSSTAPPLHFSISAPPGASPMASPSSASRTPPSPRSAAAAAAEQSPQTAQLQDVAPPVETHDSKEGIKMLIPKEEPYERKPDLLDPFLLDEDYFKALDEKHIRYDAEFSRHLMAKYFSGKAFDGGKVYDQETIIENETIKSSRYPFTSSFADPVRHYEEENRSASPAEENIKCTGQEHPSKKSS